MILDWFKNISFGQPWFFALLVLIPLLVIWYWRNNFKNQSSLVISSTKGVEAAANFKTSFHHLPFILRLLSLILFITALARPQTRNDEQQKEGEGLDIVLCIDVSGSMNAEDLQPNRLEAAKQVAANFVDGRPTDRIGLVIFSGESFTQCPITADHAVVKQQILNIKSGFLQDGTAIGTGLATSVERLKSSKAKSKVIILLTDGENNGGLIDPQTAKEIAKSLRIKVYTIGVGTDGYAPIPEATPLGTTHVNEKVNIDEKLLKQIAAETGGRYFRAKDNEGLTSIYSEIDRLEKSKIEVTTFTNYTERFVPFVMAALALLLLELLLKYSIFKKFP
ncbi:MAG: VWA domain-containing protein [Sphingobacteriales bacterium]|nr:MAG: VWA domain-containing protein [Sphingobacteriales bacterium]